MGNFSVFSIFKIFGIVSAWADKALADGKITLAEAVALATLLAEVLGVKIEIEVPVGVAVGETDYPDPQESLEKETWVPEEPVIKPIEN